MSYGLKADKEKSLKLIYHLRKLYEVNMGYDKRNLDEGFIMNFIRKVTYCCPKNALPKEVVEDLGIVCTGSGRTVECLECWEYYIEKIKDTSFMIYDNDELAEMESKENEEISNLIEDRYKNDNGKRYTLEEVIINRKKGYNE